MPIRKITKVAAAQRQLDTAITMFFAGMDDIAVYTLVIAAGTVLRNLCKHMRRDSLIDVIMNPSNKKNYISRVQKAANFFKHADRDPDATLLWNFNDELHDSLILQGCLDYLTIAGSNTWPMHYFISWFCLTHPNWIKPEARAQFETKEGEAFRAASRQQRLKLGLNGINQQPPTWKAHKFEAAIGARA